MNDSLNTIIHNILKDHNIHNFDDIDNLQNNELSLILHKICEEVFKNNIELHDSDDSNENGNKIINKTKSFNTFSLKSNDHREIIITNSVKKTKNIDGYPNLNNYVIMDKIGKGSYGKVYLAHDTITNKRFAIKTIIKPTNKLLNGELSTIQKEIAIMKKIRHKNISSLYEVIDDINENKIYIVIDYIDNGIILKKKDICTYVKINQKKARFYMHQITAGLKYLHNHNIIHRDIKPENILLDNNDNVYLVDFGISEILCEKTMVTSMRGGTLLFFSPELFSNEPNLAGPPIDIWALGITFFAMLYGYLPFDGESYREVKENITTKNIVYPKYATEIQKDLINKILCKDPKKRITLSDIRQHPFMKTPSINNANNTNNANNANNTNNANNALFMNNTNDQFQEYTKINISDNEIKNAFTHKSSNDCIE